MLIQRSLSEIELSPDSRRKVKEAFEDLDIYVDEQIKRRCEMGMNLQSGCHKCKEKVFHFRGKENETILPFYKKHRRCMDENKDNLETLEDQSQWAEWMDEYSETNPIIEGEK